MNAAYRCGGGVADALESIIARVRKELMSRSGVRRVSGRKDNSPTAAAVPLDEFVALLFEEGSAYKLAQRLGVAQTNVIQRRKWIEAQLGVQLPKGRPEVWKERHDSQHIDIQIENGTMIVGSDLHAWPETYGTAMAAYVDFHRRLQPAWSILNGDGLDGASVSKHARIGWDQAPKVNEEIEALRDFLEEIRRASPDTKRKRTRGNHDNRFDTYFSSKAAELEGVMGSTLAEHLPGWDEVMSLTVNGNCVIQHRYRSGIHAAYNNVRDYGCHVITGHRHRQEVKPWTNQLGTWYGVDSGMLASATGPQFAYTEQRKPTDWRSGFAVLTWVDHKLMPPELVQVTNEAAGEVYFRGQTLRYEL